MWVCETVSFYLRYITTSLLPLNHLAAIVQVLDFSVCRPQESTPLWLQDVLTAVQVTLAGSMCLLVVIRFVKESLQMYKMTKQLQISCYLNLLARDGMFYFVAYVMSPLPPICSSMLVG